MDAKEEILKKHIGYHFENRNHDMYYRAMDEWAKQRVTAFIEWYFTEAPWMQAENFDEGLLFADKDNDKITKEQLFELFDTLQKSKT